VEAALEEEAVCANPELATIMGSRAATANSFKPRRLMYFIVSPELSKKEAAGIAH
jgi:hypothetical protein